MYPKKVLVICENMGFGGKEGHVVSLCRELRKNGVSIVAISSGGEFTEILKELGVLHIALPLETMMKKPKEAEEFLKKTIILHKPEMVHSHFEFPKKWIYTACKKTKTPLISTVFKIPSTGFSKSDIKHFGERIIALDQIAREELETKYNIHKRNLFMSADGIDMELFAYNSKIAVAVKEELGVTLRTKVVLCVAKLEKGSDDVVRKLLMEAPTLRRRYLNTLIVIAGSGSTFEELSAAANELNEIAGEKYVQFIGGRTDIHKFYMVADVCISSSRTALEAMSAGRPVVLAGTRGFLGLLDESTVEEALRTNFSCQGHAYPDEKSFVDSIVMTFMRDASAQKALGEFGRNIIKNNFMSSRMSMDTERVYFLAMLDSPKTKFDFILAGYYGFGGAGDDVLLETIIKNLRMRNQRTSICVINKHTDYDYSNLDAALVKRNSFKDIEMYLRRSKVLVFGGGNFLQDTTRNSSLLYYMYILWLAKRYKLRTMIYGNGIGPIESPITKILVKKVLKSIDTITVRDRASHQLVKDLNTKNRRVLITGDEVFTAFNPLPQRPKGLPIKYMAVSLCELTKRDPRLFDKMASALERLSKELVLPLVFIPLENSLDSSICTQLSDKISVQTAIYEGTQEEKIAAIANSYFTLAMRPQSAIYAAASGVPMCAVGYDSQMRALCEEMETELVFDSASFNENDFYEKMYDALSSYKNLSAKSMTMSKVLSGQAMENSTEAFRLLTKRILR